MRMGTEYCMDGLPPESGVEIGAGVFLITVTHNFVGRFVAMTESFIVLEMASWVSDSGRLGSFCRDGDGGSSREQEYIGKVTIPIACLVSVIPHPHDLRTEDV